MADLFPNLPEFPVALLNDEIRLLALLPEWDERIEITGEDHAACRRLEARGLVKIERLKTLPWAISPTWYAGKLPSTGLRLATHPSTKDAGT